MCKSPLEPDIASGVHCLAVQNCQWLDPASVRVSRWSNRLPDSYCSSAYESLKRDIQESGGNVQPIKVRSAGNDYEIVFGHRRHRACLELGLPILAFIASVDDRTMWQEMERENRHRADLSPYEQGRHYKVALDSGLFPSIRSMALAIGVDASQAAKVVRIADLPTEVIAAFGSPDAIQVNWATALHRAIERDPDGIIDRAKRIGSATPPRAAASAVLEALTRDSGVEPFRTRIVEIDDATGQRHASIKQDKGRFVVVVSGPGVLFSNVEAAIRQLLSL